MTFALCAAYVAIIYVRPGEIIPGWAGFPFAEIAGLAAALSATASILLDPQRFPRLPIDWCFFGFLGAAVLSQPANGWLGGAYEALVELRPLLTFYFLIRVAILSQRQLTIMVSLVVLLTLFQAGNGAVQFHSGTGLGNSTAIVQLQQIDVDDTRTPEIRRVRGTGIFGDPNDLAMSLVIAVPFLFGAALKRGRAVTARALVGVALGLVIYALFLTQSRGGYLGFAAACAGYAYRRFGRGWFILAIAVMAGILIAAGTSRMQDLNANEDSAQGRIEAWSEGLQMLKTHPVLGVGYGSFTDYHPRVAHNSFVHACAETGALGGYFFTGMFYWFFLWHRRRDTQEDGAVATCFIDELWSAALGITTCALFLSRQYSPVLYVPLALGAARVSIAGGTREETGGGVSGWAGVAVAFAATVAVSYVAVRVLGAWAVL